VLRDLTLALLVLAGAVGGSQVPRFVQEYEQRLGGALQEATRQLEGFRAAAAGAGLDFAAYLERLRASGDPALAGTGAAIGASEGRAAALAAQARALERAPRLAKPLVLLRHHDRELLVAAWARFGWTLTLDPGFAALGALAGWLANAALWLRPARRPRPAPVRPAG
jgi:Protein of unknown function (DUF2937)